MFHDCNTTEEKKKLYRRLSKYLHPDCGGEADLMRLLTECFDRESAFSKFDPNVDDCEEEKEWDGIIRHETERILKGSEKTVLITLILAYAKENKEFKTDFVKSIKNFLDSNGFITCKQYNCLVDLFYSRKIDEWAAKTKK